MPATERAFWRTDTSTVWVGYDDDGALVFNGLDRAHLDGYEYAVTVAPDQFANLRRVLGADSGADVVDLVCAHVDEIMARGERTWLADHGIEPHFSC
ncbi:MAG TPA: hypothetical protein VHJ79_19410 [Mycobacterium sp.]|nr:hypothetical protein [Mycobacterium sp.]